MGDTLADNKVVNILVDSKKAKERDSKNAEESNLNGSQ